MMYATLHCNERAMERYNLRNEKAVMKNINRAYLYGKRAEDHTSWERNYLSSKTRPCMVAVEYNGFCYIFNEYGICVTMYDLPAWFGKKKRFNGKERIRDFRKYEKLNRNACRNMEEDYERC